MIQANDTKLKQYSSKQAAPRAGGGSPAAGMLQAFLRDLQQQRRPAGQVRRNQATETRGDVPGPRLAALLMGTSGAGGDRTKFSPPIGTTQITPQVPTKVSTEGPDTSSVDSASSPRHPDHSRSPLMLPQVRRFREPSERLLTLAQPRRPVEPPGPLRHQLMQPEDKQVMALERIRTRQKLAEAAHCQRAGSEHSSAGGLTQARLSQMSTPLGGKASSPGQPARAGRRRVDRDRRSTVGSVQGTDASHTDSAWSPRVALRPRRGTAAGHNWLPYSRRRIREPSQRILALAQPKKTPETPPEAPEAKKKKKMSESGSEAPSVLDKTSTPEERVRMRQSKAEAAHFSRATERAKKASRWRHAKEEKAAAEAAAAAKAKSYLGRTSSFAAARQAAQKVLPSAGSERRW